MSELDGRVIAIAGASGGLGPSVARRLAAGGATIAGVDRSDEHLTALGAELDLPDDRFDGRVVDLLDEQAAREWAGDLRGRFGRVDGLLHLVGGWRGGQPLPEAPLSEYARGLPLSLLTDPTVRDYRSGFVRYV